MTTYDYDTALEQVATTLGAISGIAAAYSDPPESINQYPIFIVQWLRGEGEFLSRGVTDEVATILALLFTNRQVLPSASNTARGYIDGVRAAMVADRTLNGTVTSFIGWRFEGPAGLTYGDTLHYGIRFEFDVRLASDP